MRKLILVLAAHGLLTFNGQALAQENTVRVPFRVELGQKRPTGWEIPLESLQALVDAAKENGATTAFIGGPVWSVDGKVKPKAGVYLLDNGNITSIKD